jgi:hypothetical protein
MHCTICNHPDRRDIDLALLCRRHTFESLHRQFGVTVSALFRHKKHMKENVIAARDRLNNTRRQGCLLKLTDLLEHVQQAVRTAEAEGSLGRVIRGAYVASRIIHQIDRLEVSLELETVYRLISAPGFVSQDTLLPTEPQVIADLHKSLVDFACQPCPEPPPAVSSGDACPDAQEDAGGLQEAADPNPVAALLETRNSQLAAPPAKRAARLEALRYIQNQYPDLELPAAAAKNPKIQRKITEKLPKDYRKEFSLIIENMLQNQEAMQCEKNLPKNSAKDPPG